MPACRMAMRKLREILRLSHENKMSLRLISQSCGVAASTVSGYLARAKVANVIWPLPDGMDDAALEALLFANETNTWRRIDEPDWALIHLELKKKHVTKMLVWQEYREQHPGGYEYSQFCELYRRWAGHLNVTMRQTHKAGEKLFVDFSGDGISVVDARTGECRMAKLFVAVLGASNYTYVEAVYSEDLPTWIGCHVNAFAFFGCVPEIVVPDNLKSGVKRPDYYDPDINRTYADMAQHYKVAVIPARVRKPRDKAKVEQGVLLAERWIIAALRHRDFATLAEVNTAIRPLLERMNDKPMRQVKRSRRDLFQTVDKPAMRALPPTAFTVSTWKKASVNMDYHVEFDSHYYSVHYTQYSQGKRAVEVRGTDSTVEIYWRGKRIASHVRSYAKFKHTTLPEHMPDSHRRNVEWPPSRIVAWATAIGPMTSHVVEEIMRSRPHPQQGYRACLGLLRLRDKYDDARIETACGYVVKHRMCTYQNIRTVLQTNRDLAMEPDAEAQRSLPWHNNIRGSKYYQ
jgi:transposase